jgi:hypothetical protein
MVADTIDTSRMVVCAERDRSHRTLVVEVKQCSHAGKEFVADQLVAAHNDSAHLTRTYKVKRRFLG